MTPTQPGATPATGQLSPPAGLPTAPCTTRPAPGDYAELNFVGTNFKLTFTGNVNRGNLDVYVDNVKVGTVNQYSSSLTWQKTWTSPTFTNGTHTLKLVHATGSIVGIDAIEIDPAPPVPVGTGTYDDTDTAWGYSGNWTALSTSGPANGTLHYSTSTGD